MPWSKSMNLLLIATALAGCSHGPPQAPIGLNKVPANPSAADRSPSTPNQGN